LVGGYQPRGDILQTDATGKFEVEWNPRQFGGQNDATACILVRDTEHNLAVAQDLDEDTTNLDSVPTNSARRRDIWERICLKSGWDNE
jgi:hypothetical protein